MSIWAVVVAGIGIVVGIIGQVIGSLAKRNQAKQDEEIRDIKRKEENFEKEMLELRNIMIELKSKLWSDEKLSKTITDAVNLALTDWQLKMFKEGYFISNPKK